MRTKPYAPKTKRNEVNGLQCTLMNKKIKAAEMDDATGFIGKIGTVYALMHLPVGFPVRRGNLDRVALNL